LSPVLVVSFLCCLPLCCLLPDHFTIMLLLLPSFLLFVSSLTLTQSTESSGSSPLSCNRTLSHRARSLIESAVGHILSTSTSLLSPSCPLRLDNEMYAELINYSVIAAGYRATCGYCGKAFRAVPFLEAHLEHRHIDRVNTHGHCLAELCSWLPCPPTRHEPEARRVYASQVCDEMHMQNVRHKCYAMVRDCTEDTALRDQLNHRLCAHVSCEYFRVLFASSRNFNGWEVLHVIGAALTCTISILLYLILFIAWGERTGAGSFEDTRRRYPKEDDDFRDYTEMLLDELVKMGLKLGDWKRAGDGGRPHDRRQGNGGGMR